MKKEFNKSAWAKPEDDEMFLLWLRESLSTHDELDKICEMTQDWCPPNFTATIATVINNWARNNNVDRLEVLDVINYMMREV